MFLHRISPTVLFVTLLSISLVLAQQSQCEEIVLEMWIEADENCEALGGNEACYALNRLETDFVNPDDLPEEYFSEPGDFADLLELENIVPVVFDPEIPEWGVSVFNVQANIPNSLPGQYVKVILMGDIDVENGVEAEESIITEYSLPVETTSGSNMYYFPRSDSKFIQTVPSSASLEVDAISDDGRWVRVVYNEKPGWIIRNVLNEDSNAALLNLPMISEETQTSMQAFYFSTGIGNPSCNEAPSTLMIQGPEDFAVDITANGAQIRIGSTIIVRTRSENRYMQVLVLAGQAEVFPDTPDEILIPTGHMVEFCVLNKGDFGIDGEPDDFEVVECEAPRPMTADEIADLSWAESIPSGLLNYPIILTESQVEATAEPEVAPEATPFIDPEECEKTTEWTDIYLVQVGDTLTWIAESYALSVEELAIANCIEYPDFILPNQELLVPQIEVPEVEIPTPVGPTPTVDAEVKIAQTNPLPGPITLQNSTYTIRVINHGPINATNVTVNHSIPGILTGTTTNPSQGSYSGGVWTIGNLGIGQIVNMTVTGAPNAPSGTVYSPSAAVTLAESDSNFGNNSATTNITVQASVDLTVTIAQTNPLPGPMPLEASTYTISVTNNGPDNATGVTVSHNAPATVTGAAYTPSVGAYAAGTWTIGNLANGATETMTVTGAPNGSSGTTYSPSATASSTETETAPADNTGTATITIQPIIVNTTNLAGLPGGCTSADCTLGEALALANTLAGADTIGFSVAGTITLAGTNFTLNSNVTINGAGITVDGANASRAFTVNGGVTATIDGMTITNGNDASFNGGGGILNNGNLTLTNAAVNGNTALFGGGITSNGTLTMTNTNVNNNTVSNEGGGLYINGNTTINGGNINNNSVTPGGGLGGGGMEIAGGTVNITGTTFTGNNLEPTNLIISGGAIEIGGGNLTLTGVTMTGNTASLSGGGISVFGGGTAAAGGSNITTNAPDDCGGAITDNGGNTPGTVGCGW